MGAGSEGEWASEQVALPGVAQPDIRTNGKTPSTATYGTNLGTFIRGLGPAGDMTLGDWGVNTSNDTVWAVVNYDGDFAVCPNHPLSPFSRLAPSALSAMSCGGG